MNMTRAERLGSVPLLRALPPDRLESMTTQCIQRTVPTRKIIDLAPHTICIVHAGRVALVPSTHDGIIALAEPGDLLGETWLLERPPPYRLLAVEPTTLLCDRVFPSDISPAVLAELAALLADRLERSVQAASDLARRDAPARIAARLCSLAEHHARRTGSGLALPRAVTHGLLAASVGTSRESVARSFALFRRQGWIRTVAGSPVIVDLDGLRARAR